MQVEWVTLPDYFSRPLSQWDTGRIKYWAQEEKLCKDKVSSYLDLYWRAILLTQLPATLRIKRKAIHMTKGHSLKFVFPRMGTIGASTLYEEKWSGKKTRDYIQILLLTMLKPIRWFWDFEKVTENLISAKISVPLLHELCYFYKCIELKYRQKSSAPTKPNNCVFKHTSSLRKWSIKCYVLIPQV